jgi:cell division protein FtsL
VVAARCQPGHMPALPGSAIEFEFRRLHKGARIIGIHTIRVTHLAEKALQMRHKTPSLLRNSQKNRSLQRRK